MKIMYNSSKNRSENSKMKHGMQCYKKHGTTHMCNIAKELLVSSFTLCLLYLVKTSLAQLLNQIHKLFVTAENWT